MPSGQVCVGSPLVVVLIEVVEVEELDALEEVDEVVGSEVVELELTGAPELEAESVPVLVLVSVVASVAAVLGPLQASASVRAGSKRYGKGMGRTVGDTRGAVKRTKGCAGRDFGDPVANMRRALLVVMVLCPLACAGEPSPVTTAQAEAPAPVERLTAEALYERGTPASGGFREVSVDDLARARENVRVVDVRQPDEFSGDLGHVPGATLVPLATLAEAAKAWDREAPIVLVCRSGRRSSQAASELAAAGFTRVMNLSGGTSAYRERGHATER